jgi:hypothetical protein
MDNKHSTILPVQFLLAKGICGGIGNWFLCLYFKTLPHFKDKDPQAHLMAITKLFENGAPRQAEMLQLFNGASEDFCHSLLGFEVKEEKDKNLKFIKTPEDKEKSNQYIKDLTPGVYFIHFSQGCGSAHALYYFKINDNLGFLFDPNIGLIKLKENSQAEDLTEKFILIANLLRFDVEYTGCHFYPVVPCDEYADTEGNYILNIEDF